MVANTPQVSGLSHSKGLFLPTLLVQLSLGGGGQRFGHMGHYRSPCEWRGILRSSFHRQMLSSEVTQIAATHSWLLRTSHMVLSVVGPRKDNHIRCLEDRQQGVMLMRNTKDEHSCSQLSCVTPYAPNSPPWQQESVTVWAARSTGYVLWFDPQHQSFLFLASAPKYNFQTIQWDPIYIPQISPAINVQLNN